MNIYFGLLASMYVRSYFCYVAYDIFPGFDAISKQDQVKTDKSLEDNSTIGISNLTDVMNEKILVNKTSVLDSTRTEPSNASTTLTTTITPNTTAYTLPLIIKAPIFNCSEDEKPFHIGLYEVPTQRDLVLLIKKALLRSFNSYQQKSLYLLKDIQGATRSTSEIAHKCSDEGRYRKCVKRVSVKSQVIVKSLVISLERQRADVGAFIDGTICKVKQMKADPMQVLETLAKEEAALEFALPGFLRLLGACTVYCTTQPKPKTTMLKPLRHMTDQDLVVKHFLTKKNYLQLLKGSK